MMIGSNQHAFHDLALSGAQGFCKCSEGLRNNEIEEKRLKCSCGEEYRLYDWAWDDTLTTSAVRLSLDNREVQFHPGYSNGTAAVQGNVPLLPENDYYWEIKVLTPLYGTDVMIGVGTSKVDIQKHNYNFLSLLGTDEESWGFSYRGLIQHKSQWMPYAPPFGQGCLIGVHLDLWRGELEFFLNRRPLGIAFKSLSGRTLYPMLCSTAAKSSMRVTYSASAPITLQLLCLQSIRNKPKLLKVLRDIPFMNSYIAREYWWMFPEGDDDKGYHSRQKGPFNPGCSQNVQEKQPWTTACSP